MTEFLEIGQGTGILRYVPLLKSYAPLRKILFRLVAEHSPMLGINDGVLRHSPSPTADVEHLYERWGALVLKRYVPTGGDLVMRRLRRHHPDRRWVTSTLQSLCQYEQRTRLNELIHLIGFVGCTVLITSKFSLGSLTVFWLILALALNLILGLWPVVLQRYNRLYRAIYAHSRLLHRSAKREPGRRD